MSITVPIRNVYHNNNNVIYTILLPPEWSLKILCSYEYCNGKKMFVMLFQNMWRRHIKIIYWMFLITLLKIIRFLPALNHTHKMRTSQYLHAIQTLRKEAQPVYFDNTYARFSHTTQFPVVEWQWNRLKLPILKRLCLIINMSVFEYSLSDYRVMSINKFWKR